MITATSQPAAAASRRPPPAARRRRRGRSRRHGWIAVLFLLPMAALYGVYYLYSFFFLFRVSRQQVTLSFTGAVNVGWQNFRLVLTDPVFQHALENNLLFAAFSIAIALSLGFVVAVLLATGVRLRSAMYVLFLLPSLIPLSLFATVFGQMLQTQYGQLNGLLRGIGLGFLQQDWLGNTDAAYAAVFILLTYLIGLPIMYYRADVEAINMSLIEAAVIDGAGTWRMFRSVLFPLLKNTHKTVILSVLLGGFRAFDVIYFSTNGAPSNQTNITGTYIYYQTVAGGSIGYASAASLVLLLIAFVISAAQIIVSRRSGR